MSCQFIGSSGQACITGSRGGRWVGEGRGVEGCGLAINQHRFAFQIGAQRVVNTLLCNQSCSPAFDIVHEQWNNLGMFNSLGCISASFGWASGASMVDFAETGGGSAPWGHLPL